MESISVKVVRLFLVSILAFSVQAKKFDPNDIEITTVKLNDTLYILRGKGGNIGVSAGDDGVLIIDNQFKSIVDKNKAALAKISDKAVRFVINTHWHFDHTDANESFGEAGAIIVAHENSRERMKEEQYLAWPKFKQRAYSKDGLPILTFNDAISFHFNNEQINVFHTEPAHTDGDVIIHFVKSNVIHTGDIFVTYAFPFIDVPHGGNINGWINALSKVSALADDATQIIPGHGPVSNKKDMLKFQAMLITIRDRIQTLISTGKSLEVVLASDPTRGFKGRKKNEFVKAIYQSLQTD